MTSPKPATSNTDDSLSLGHPAFLLLNLAYILVFSHVALFYLYPIALDEMGAGSRVIGWVMGVFSLAAVLSRPLMGAIAARRGEFFLMSGGTAVMLMASACYPFLESVGVLMFLVRLVHGLGFSGFIMGAVVSGWIAARLGLDGLFYMTAAMAAVGFLLCLTTPIRKGT